MGTAEIAVQKNIIIIVLHGAGGGNVSGDLLRKLLSKRLVITGTTLRSRSLEVPSNNS